MALEQSRLREELIVHNESLEALNRSRTQFLANVSHELRTPLTAVVGLASEMRDRLDHIAADEIGDFAHLIASSSSEVAGIVEDLLAIARVEQGELTLIPEEIDLHEIARTAVETWNPTESASIQVVGDRCKAWADPLRVRQIVRNLCSNARHHGGDTIEIRVRADQLGPTLTVVDNGNGVPEAEREAIFHAYIGAGTDRTRSSVGLGLTVSRQLAQAMRGDLTYRYTEDESRFQLQLPAAAVQPLPTTASPVPREALSPSQGMSRKSPIRTAGPRRNTTPVLHLALGYVARGRGLVVHDTASGEDRQILDGLVGDVCLAFSSDGRIAMTSRSDRLVTVFDSESGSTIAEVAIAEARGARRGRRSYRLPTTPR